MKKNIGWLLWMMPIVLTALFVFTGAKPARAEACFQDLRDCYGRAAMRDAWWDRWAAGLDCEVDFADCVRRQVVGR
jgi:hypothetical protein